LGLPESPQEILASTIDHHHCLNGGIDRLHTGVCGCSVYLFDLLTVKKNLKSKIRSAGLITIITILFTEVASRFLFPQPISGSWQILQKSGLVTNRGEGKALHSHFSTPTIEYKFDKFFSRIHSERINSLPETSCKILVLGDSFTFGWLVSDKELFINKLEVSLNSPHKQPSTSRARSIHFINVAKGGWGLADFSAYIDDYKEIIPSSFDAIAIFVNSDDANRAVKSDLYIHAKKGLIRAPATADTQKFVKEIIQNSIINNLYQFLLERYNIVRLIRSLALYKTPLRANTISSQPLSSSDSIHAEWLQSDSSKEEKSLINSLIKKISVNAKSIGIPVFFTYIGSASPKSLHGINREYIGQWGSDQLRLHDIPHDFSLISNAPVYDSRGVIKGDGHPNDIGHSEISRSILESTNAPNFSSFVTSTCE